MRLVSCLLVESSLQSAPPLLVDHTAQRNPNTSMLTPNPNRKMKYQIPTITAIAAITLASPATAVTLLFADNFNEGTPNEVAESFNNNLAGTQSGTIVAGGPITYALIGSGNATQHSNGGNQLTLANFPGQFGNNVGRVSLNYNFATQANALDQALVFSFQIKDVFSFDDPSEWVSFTVGETQLPFITEGSAGALFRINGGTQLWTSGTGTVGPSWAPNDYITITLSGADGNSSAFNNGGSIANIKIGSTDAGTFTLSQQTNAYLTFSSSSPSSFGGGNFDNLSVSAVPEPSAALLGGLGALALLRRRRA